MEAVPYTEALAGQGVVPAEAARLLIDFLYWAISSAGGQSFAAGLGYAPLPAALVERARAKLDAIRLDSMQR